MSGATYPVGTIADMARIPMEALPRFLAELPVILAEIRRLNLSVDAVNDLVGTRVFESAIIEGAEWIDDDLQMANTTVSVEGFEDIKVSRHFGAPDEGAA